jgi:hypothetical protein
VRERGQEGMVCVEYVRCVEESSRFVVDSATGGEDGWMEACGRRGLVVVPHAEVLGSFRNAHQIHGVRAEKLGVYLVPELCGESEE